MNLTLTTIALLAGLTLASSCHSSRDVNQTVDNRPRLELNDSIERDVTRPGGMPAVRNIEEDMYAPRTLIIFYDTEVGKAALDTAIDAYGAEVIYHYNVINAISIRIPEDKDINAAIEHFKRVEGVTTVNRDRIMQLH